MPASPRATAVPITDQLIKPMRSIIEHLDLDPDERLAMLDQWDRAVDQQVLLNNVLRQIGGIAEVAMATASAIVVPPAGVASSTAYILPIVGPEAAISSTSFIAITHPTPVRQHAANVALEFYWEAEGDGDALWQLKDQTSGFVLLSGTSAAPFSSTRVSATISCAMPADGNEVALEVAAPATDGLVTMFGVATWEVQ